MHHPELSGIARPRKAFHSKYFTLYARLASTKKQTLRLAFGARTGTATVRNRAKRLARETFRLNRQRLPAGIDILIAAKRGLSALSRRDIRSQILDLFEYARILSPLSPPNSTGPDDANSHC